MLPGDYVIIDRFTAKWRVSRAPFRWRRIHTMARLHW